MLKYAAKRIMLAIVTIFIIMVVTFFAMNAIPGGPFDKEKAPDPAVRLMLEKRFHLDKPVLQQFFIYTGNLLRGDFGVSLKTGAGQHSSSNPFPFQPGWGHQCIGGLDLWAYFGLHCCTDTQQTARSADCVFTTLSVGVPSFVLGTVLLWCSLILKWVPVWSIANQNYILPVIALSLYPMAHVTRLTKSSMLDVLEQDYIRTARARACGHHGDIQACAAQCLIPVVTYIGPLTAYSLTGSMVVETIFTIGGLGTKFVTSINNRDYPVIMGTTIFLAVLMVIMTLISDLMYSAVDPRISFD